MFRRHMLPSDGLHAVRVNMIGADQRADQTHALFDQIDRHALQCQLIIAALIALEYEAAAFAEQQAGLIDGLAVQSVASMARAA